MTTNGERAARAERMGYRIRPPRLDDAEAIGRVHLTVWQQAYDGLIAPEFLRSLSVEASVELWREILRDPDRRPANRLVGVAPTGTVAGMIAWGASRDEDPVVPHELHAIDILAEHHGTGLADMLMLASLGPDGAHSLWVLSANARAQAFYRRYGFVAIGPRRHDTLLDAEELLMVREIG